MARQALALLLCAVPLSLGCSKSSGDSPPPAATSAAPATVTAAVSAAVPASAAVAHAEPPIYPPKKIPGGMLNGMWVQPFEIVRDKGNVGLSYLDASNRCVGYGKVLCSDTEWARACETDATLAKIETWTASGVGNNRFVTRGGDEASGCRARDLKDGADLSPTRAAVCCDPDIAIRTTARQDELLSGTTKKLFAYQRAMRSGDTLALGDLYADKVTFMGKERSNADIIKIHQASFTKDPGQWTMFDTCTFGVDRGTTDGGADAKVTVDCRTMYKRGDAVIVAMQRLVWGGPSMKIMLIGDAVTAHQPMPDGTVLEEKELKERVGILLTSD